MLWASVGRLPAAVSPGAPSKGHYMALVVQDALERQLPAGVLALVPQVREGSLHPICPGPRPLAPGLSCLLGTVGVTVGAGAQGC